jgi:hypothetical protein
VSRRTVFVAPERLDRWLTGFGERHGEVTYDVTPTSVTLSAGTVRRPS